MSNKKDLTFEKDGKRRIVCSSCGKFLKEQRLTDNKNILKTCPKCKSKTFIPKAYKGNFMGEPSIYYGPGNAMITSDLTGPDVEIED